MLRGTSDNGEISVFRVETVIKRLERKTHTNGAFLVFLRDMFIASYNVAATRQLPPVIAASQMTDRAIRLTVSRHLFLGAAETCTAVFCGFGKTRERCYEHPPFQ